MDRERVSNASGARALPPVPVEVGRSMRCIRTRGHAEWCIRNGAGSSAVSGLGTLRRSMLRIIRILLILPAAFAARLVGHDVLDLGFAGTAAVFVIIIGFAIWATGRTISHDP